MSDMPDLKALAAPFSPTTVSWRIGSTTADKSRGMALAYIDARDVMDRLDDVCGPEGWQTTYPHAGQKTVCSIGILCGEHWVWKSNGAGDSDIEAEKGALSDAFKRAAVMWGVGRYLYSVASPWVEIETRGRTSVIKDAEYKRLADILQKAGAGMKAPPEAPPSPPPPTVPRQASAHGLRLAAEEPESVARAQGRLKGQMVAPATQAGFDRPATSEEARKLKIKNGVDRRIQALKDSAPWTRAELDDFWNGDKEWIAWMADANNDALTEYQRFTDAFAEAEMNMKEVA